MKHNEWSSPNAGEIYSRGPMWVSAPSLLVSPERRALEEASYSRWLLNQAQPLSTAFCGVCDYSDELVEEFYRGQWAFGRTRMGQRPRGMVELRV